MLRQLRATHAKLVALGNGLASGEWWKRLKGMLNFASLIFCCRHTQPRH